MTSKANSFESGAPSLTDVTTGNSAFPDAFQNVVRSAAGAIVRYTNASVAHGSLALQTAVGSTPGRAYVEWSTGNDGQSYARFNAKLGTPTSNHRILQFGNTAGSCMDLELRTDRTIRLRNAYGTSYHQTQPLPLDTWMRFEVFGRFQEGTGTTALRVYTASDTWELFDSFDGDDTAGLRGAPTYLRLGAVDDTTIASHLFDDWAVRSDAYPGPVVPPNLLPVAASQYRRAWFGDSATLTTSATDPDDGAVTYAYSVAAAPLGAYASVSASGPSATVTCDRSGVIELACTITDDEGDTVTIPHIVEFVNGAWTGTWPGLVEAWPELATSQGGFGSAPFGSAPFGA
jgi:hypothetical protein